MIKKTIVMLAALPVLAACQDITTANSSMPSPFIAEVPESILEIAAPGQNLSALMIDPVDGCYTYQHVGPVENTMLPLRASNGRPICTRVEPS